ncbi:MBOAT family protein [Romboutsia sp. 1001216sp1]|nr:MULTISPECIES: MBOAT family protein [unclassified Romboutsia]MDB8792755.1 MBOAT family protein [Romboutsia sp. 1001216sp1]MDB8795443.1 MBOAT family protein [Romboutsia sp. 1001216sp1]MDB8799253.1 MBOAT family protein [Romboutsia sp. 1001216sp1]
MVFSSITFLFYFLPLVLFFYFISPNKIKNLVLLVFSLIFYAWGEPVYIFIMLFSCIVDYVHALIIDKYRGTLKSKLALISSIIINLSLLVFFKYSDFFISILNSLINLNIPLLNLSLPIGISFYTFQTMSYSIDVYRNDSPVQKNIINLGTFITLFPQLVAGPIVRYHDISHQLINRCISFDKIYEGVYRFIIGILKKVIIANNLGAIWFSIKSIPFFDLSNLTAWLGIICFTLQIYFDFSGYSDMAIGLGKIFGFDLLENFNFPYISKSITEFWRRWHISLGIWFRDYLYIPLGGNRCSKSRWIFNIFIVWFLTGLWHGASFNFILWGLYFGIILIIEKLFLLEILKKLPKFLSHIYVMFLVIIGFVIFEITDINSILIYLGSMFNFNNTFVDSTFYYYFIPNIILIVFSIIASTPIIKIILDKYEILRFITLIVGFIVATSFLLDSSFNPFLYFRF